MTSTSWLDFNGHRKPEILKRIFTTARYGQIRRLLVITQVLYDFFTRNLYFEEWDVSLHNKPFHFRADHDPNPGIL